MSASSTPASVTRSGTPQPSDGSGGGGVKPTLLAFHGSGSNATIHTIQMARLSRLLKPHFDIISLDAPYPSPAGPGILPFFEGCGPYHRWIPPSETLSIAAMRSGSGSSTLPPEVEDLVHSTITSVAEKGSRVVGLLGFSQGTRVVAGLLKAAEIVQARAPGDAALAWLDFRFAVSVCGSYPPPLVPGAAKALVEGEGGGVLAEKIKVPTLHVQGEKDEWDWAGKLLVEGSFDVGGDAGTGTGTGRGSEVLRLDMGHHYPVKAEDSKKIADWVLSVWKDVGGEGGDVAAAGAGASS
ncbi:hypothetical protein CC80DRAFT_30132 [Byssothecium circinans]|uniref:Serine hydrolase domain-containing protein n=1 Tax=Byssothecium circinans TaxID=147558 RepID=A0A6A5TZS4_9PLEO|nr:hypothetical protein CC80DRAFT_30132 [Byssothecium circinans]